MTTATYVRQIDGISVPSGMTDEQFIQAWRERLTRQRMDRVRVVMESGEEPRTYHEPDCECGTCQLNDQLGYDADVSDPSQYCRHGTFIGSWWGPDYMCGACESGYEPSDGYMAWRNRKRRIRSVKPRTRIGTSTLRDIAARVIQMIEYENAAQKRRQTNTDDYRRDRLRKEKEDATARRIAAFTAYCSVLTEAQEDWLRQVIGNPYREKERESFEAMEWTLLKEGTEGAENLIATLESGYRSQLPRKDDPLRYYTPRISPTDALERQSALVAWIRGIHKEMDDDCTAWLTEQMNAEGWFPNSAIERTEWINRRWGMENGVDNYWGKAAYLPARYEMLPIEHARLAGGFWWHIIDAWRRSR